jgi:tRNA modification GTPase
MDRPSYGDEVPIVAIATPLAESALSIVRSSGKDAVAMASRAFSRPEALRSAAGNTIVHGWIQDPEGKRIDEVLASVFRSPHSYTGEEAVDFSCHGGTTAARAVFQALVAAGFREALPGEFTFRAFMNGKIDLTRSESVMELVSAKTDEARDRAIGRLSGELETEIRSIKDQLVVALAAAELFLDYSEDDGVGPPSSSGIDEEAAGLLSERQSVISARDRLAALAASYRVERLYRDGATVAVAGRPNAGKSRLFNRLLREERSIVAPTPGTTRDWIEAWISIEGIPLRLVDTAGLREAADPVERIGVERSRDVLGGADLILYVVDGTIGENAEDAAFLAAAHNAPLVPIWNKVDSGAPPAPAAYLRLSAATGEGIPELASRIVALLEGQSGDAGGEASSTAAGYGGKRNSRVGVASERQKSLIDRALTAVGEALSLADAGRPLDLVSRELREAVDALGEITGEVSTADILETMFGRFCVGK